MTRVLVVDDTEDIVALVKTVTQRMGFVTQTLNDTVRFMTTFVRFKPDIIVLDIVMPNIDGIELTQWLTDVGYTGRLIIMSGFADHQRMAEAIGGAGGRIAITSLAKPFRIAELKAALQGEAKPAAPDRALNFSIG